MREKKIETNRQLSEKDINIISTRMKKIASTQVCAGLIYQCTLLLYTTLFTNITSPQKKKGIFSYVKTAWNENRTF